MRTDAAAVLPLRRSVRLVLLNERDEVLLMQLVLPGRTVWCTIGGGVEAGEETLQAALREAKEEIGFDAADLVFGPTVWQGEHVFDFGGVPTRHEEQFVLARTRRSHLDAGGMTAEEKVVVKALRWWSLSELIATSEVIVPPSLRQHLGPLIDGQIPERAETIELGD